MSGRRSPDPWDRLGFLVDRWVSWLVAWGLSGDPPAGDRGQPAAPAGHGSLDDDDVKLVPYSIISVRRGHERYVRGGTTVVADRMTPESFVAWRISQLMSSEEVRSGAIPILPGEEKYLRVSFAVTRRWPRQPLDHEVEELRTLERIYGKLAAGADAGADAPAGSEERSRTSQTTTSTERYHDHPA